MTVFLVQVTNRKQTVNNFFARFPDTNQNARSKRNLQFSGLTDHFYSDFGPFVGRGKVRHAALTQPWADVFQHESETDVDVFERLHFVMAQHAGIGVGQDAVGQRDFTRLIDVGCCRGVAKASQGFPIARKGVLGLIAQAHEGLFTALFLGTLQPALKVLRAHGPGVRVARVLPKGTVRAAVPTQIGDG